MTDEQTNDDDEEKGKQEEQGQGRSKAIYASNDRTRVEALGRRKYTIHNGRVVTPETIKQLKNHAIVHIVDRFPGGGKKGQKKQNKDETSSSESDALQDMFIELIQKDSGQGNNFFQTLM